MSEPRSPEPHSPEPYDAPADVEPAPHLASLRPLIGRWRTTGTALDRQGRAMAEIHGHDSWTVLPGGRWVAHQSSTRVGDRLVHLHQVIGGEHPDGGWQMLAFDEGPIPELTRLTADDGGDLRIVGEGVRAVFRLPTSPSGSMTSLWERHVDTYWTTWLTISYEPAAG